MLLRLLNYDFCHLIDDAVEVAQAGMIGFITLQQSAPSQMTWLLNYDFCHLIDDAAMRGTEGNKAHSRTTYATILGKHAFGRNGLFTLPAGSLEKVFKPLPKIGTHSK